MRGDQVHKDIAGRIFCSDGTTVYKETKIEVDIARGPDTQRYSTLSKDDGRFFISIDQPWTGRAKVYVKGEPVERSRIRFTPPPDAQMIVVMPKLFGEGRGDSGGLITGKVIDEDGSEVEGAKVEAKVISTSMFGMLSPKFAETKTDKWGRFALAFDGGTQIKSLTVDGHAPQRATRKTRDQEDVDVPADVLNAGAFNLTLVRQKKFLGIW